MELNLEYTGTIALERDNGKKSYEAGYSIFKLPADPLDHFLCWLHEDERDYYQSLEFEKRKISYLLGRISGKQAIHEIAPTDKPSNIAIIPGVFNYPVVKFISNANIQVSISHCEYIGISLAFPEEHPLAVDIERIQDDNSSIIKESTAENEFGLTSKCYIDDATKFTMLWSIKESVSKIIRTGLTTDFKLFEIDSFQQHGEEFSCTFKNFMQYRAVAKKIGDYVCSVVMPEKTTCKLEEFWSVIYLAISNEERV